jgi:hypothetical protein
LSSLRVEGLGGLATVAAIRGDLDLAARLVGAQPHIASAA